MHFTFYPLWLSTLEQGLALLIRLLGSFNIYNVSELVFTPICTLMAVDCLVGMF
jgi:hypothetical protein